MLVIFAFSLAVIIGMAALVFDGGLMLLERRTQLNAADAAALAGARFLPDEPGRARAAAFDVATANGFTDSVNGQTVEVHVPPVSGPNTGSNGHIEVLIGSTRDSLFAAIWGVADLEVNSRSVAANQEGVRGPFALLSLDPHGCEALIVEGQGELVSYGTIHVNSDCESAMRLAGQGEIVSVGNHACNIAGGLSAGGGANYDCEVNEGEQAIEPEPLAGLDEPPIPTDGAEPPNIVYPTPAVQEGGTTKDIPEGCPGGDAAATHETPALCHFPGSYSGTTWRLYAGYYPGGIHLEAGDFYLEPGIYYLGGGGITVNGGGAGVTTVDANGGTTLGGGVMFYNGDHPTAADGAIYLAGGDAGVNLWPIDDESSPYNGIVIFQDREVCEDVLIVGASSHMEVRGTIYVPGGDSCPAGHPVVIVEGNGGTVTTDQIIAFRFQMKGNAGTLTVAFDAGFLPNITVAGLVE